LLLDTGDALVESEAAGNKASSEVVVAGMNLMGYDAMALGPNELSLGVTLLRQRMEEVQFPVLSANVLRSDTKELVTAPYVVLQVGSCRVGVIGLTRPPDGDLVDFRVLEPREVLPSYVSEVAEQADTVVLLTNLEYRSAQDLVQVVPGIDLVIAALPTSPPYQAVRIPETGTLAVTAEQPAPGHTGRLIGRLVATLASDGSLGSESWMSVPMDSAIADDPEMASLLDRYR
jgi:2',3'-cyclic-nucleotide 2'-phosphodiesterase (5'-nucleotidase family)